MISLGLGFNSVSAQEESENNSELILYVRQGCGHCSKVKAFISNNDLDDEVEIKDLGVDEGAVEEFNQFLDDNEVPIEERGVPVLRYEDDRWAMGDTPIIEYLRDRYDIKEDKDWTETILLVGGTAVLTLFLGYGVYNALLNKKK